MADGLRAESLPVAQWTLHGRSNRWLCLGRKRWRDCQVPRMSSKRLVCPEMDGATLGAEAAESFCQQNKINPRQMAEACLLLTLENTQLATVPGGPQSHAAASGIAAARIPSQAMPTPTTISRHLPCEAQA